MSSLENAILSDHARRQLARRGIHVSHIRAVLEDPESIHPVRPARVVAQGIVQAGSPPRDYLLRVFVDVDRIPPEIVTAYRTSKIEKYRGTP